MAIWIFVPVYFFSSDEKCRIIFYRSLANIDFLLSLVFHGVIKLNLQCTTTQYYPFHVKTLSFFFSTTRLHLFFAFWGPDPSPVIVRLGLGLEFLSLNFLETFICNKVCILQKKVCFAKSQISRNWMLWRLFWSEEKKMFILFIKFVRQHLLSCYKTVW